MRMLSSIAVLAVAIALPLNAVAQTYPVKPVKIMVGASAGGGTDIIARMRRIRYIGNSSPENWKGAMGEHEEMIAALVARDGKRMARAMQLHMANTWPRVSSTVAAPDGAV